VILMWIVTWMLWRFLKAAIRKLKRWMGNSDSTELQLPKT